MCTRFCANLRRLSTARTQAVCVWHHCCTFKSCICLQRKADEVDLEQIWADAKRAADEAGSWRGKAASKHKSNDSKGGGHSRLKAMMEKAETEHKEANRKLPRYERQSLPSK